LHNFSARLWEQLVHFHVMRLTDSLFLWVGATPHLRNLAVAMCSRYVPCPHHLHDADLLGPPGKLLLQLCKETDPVSPGQATHGGRGSSCSHSPGSPVQAPQKGKKGIFFFASG
ncbi:LOW QUALITY PROTEIN: PSMG4 isoform 11, partial [Pongo abelii]